MNISSFGGNCCNLFAFFASFRSLKLNEYHEQDEILRLRSAAIKKVRGSSFPHTFLNL